MDDHHNHETLNQSHGPIALLFVDNAVESGEMEWIPKDLDCDLEREPVLLTIFLVLRLVPLESRVRASLS